MADPNRHYLYMIYCKKSDPGVAGGIGLATD